MKKRYGYLLAFALLLTFLMGCTAPAAETDTASDKENKPAVSDVNTTSDTGAATSTTTKNSTSDTGAETSTTNAGSSTSGITTEAPVATSTSATVAPTSNTTTAVPSATVTEDRQNNSSATTNAKYISRDEAKRIALTAAGVAEQDISHLEVELDYDDDCRRWEYEVSFNVGRTEYDCEINAEDGTVIELTREVD